MFVDKGSGEPLISNSLSSASSNLHERLIQVLIEVIVIAIVVVVSSVRVWQIRNKRRRARQTAPLQYESADEEVPAHSEMYK